MSQTSTRTENDGFNFSSFLRDNAVKIIALVFWLAIVVAVVVYQRSTGLGPQALAADLAEQLQQNIAGTWWGALVYILVYFLRPIILFPASILTILGGNLYGAWLGVPLVVLAGSISAIIPYFAGRWLFGSATEAADEADAEAGRLRKFADALRDNPFQTVVTMRLLFLPYDGVSIFAGSLNVPFIPFFIATAVGNIVGSMPFVLLGASVEGNPFTADAEFRPWVFGLAAVLLVLSIGGSQLYKRMRGDDRATPATE